MAADYIGRVISLTSLSDIRYVGTLNAIDKVAATISLEKVRSMGTEGRKGNPAEELPPNDNVYEYIVFRASDVKALNVEEVPTHAAPPVPQLPQDPAILNSGPHGGFDARSQYPAGFPGQPPIGPYGFPPPLHGPPQYGGYSPFGPPPPQQQQQGVPGSGPPGAPRPYGPETGQILSPGPPPQPGPTPIAPPQKAAMQSPPGAPASTEAPKSVQALSQQPPITAPPAALPARAPANAKPEPGQHASKPSVQPAKAPVTASAPSKPASFAQAAASSRHVNGTKPAPAESDSVKPIEGGIAALNVSASTVDEPTMSGPTGTRRGTRGGQHRGPTLPRQHAPSVPLPANDFDFIGANAKFQKDDTDAPTVESKSLYDKQSSFFDNISSDLSQRAANQMFDRRKERQQNVDTFGEAGSFNNFNRRGRGRGRGARGFRGGRGQAQRGSAV